MDSFCAIMEIIPIRASVHRQVWLWQHNLCGGAKQCCVDLESGASHVGQIGFVYALVQRGLEPSKMKGNIQE